MVNDIEAGLPLSDEESPGDRRSDLQALCRMLHYISGEAERCGFPKAAALAELGRLEIEGDLRLV